MAQPTVPNINILSFKQQDTSVGKFLNWSLQYGRIIIIVTEFLVIAAFISRFYFDRVLSDLNDNISNKSTIVKQSERVENKFIQFQARITEVGQLIDNRKDFSVILNYLNTMKPNGVDMRDLVLSTNGITFTAQADTLPSFNTFFQNLTESKRLADLSVEDVAIKEGKVLISVKAALKPEAFKREGTP